MATARAVSSPSVFEFRKLRGIGGIGLASRPKSVTQAVAHVITAKNFRDFVKVLIEKAFFIVRNAPLRHERATARHNPGDAVLGQWDMRFADARVNREIVDALLGLFFRSRRA